MDIRLPKTANELHHAYVIEDADGVFDALHTFLKNAFGTSEMYVREFETLGIEDSRELVHMAHMRSFGEQFFVFRIRSCTREAQNALLKILEEPPAHTYFFFSVAGARDLLPTLRSRVFMLDDDTEQEHTQGAAFLHAAAGERMTLLEPLIKDKDAHAASALLQDIEHELYRTRAHVHHAFAVQHIRSVRRVLRDKGASVKVLMESVALTTPKV